MESGRFTGFFRNAPFDKPGLLRGFRGFSPPFLHDPPDHLAKGDALLVLLLTAMRAPVIRLCAEVYKKYFIHNDQLPVQ